MKLGKGVARSDPRTVMLGFYVKESIPVPPVKTFWEYKKTAWHMFKNDQLGDCTCASAGHLIQNWTSHSGTEQVVSDDEIVSAYSEISGYNPLTGINDNGAVELDVLNFWRKQGIAGKRIEGYVGVSPTNVNAIRQAIFLFGGAYIGLQLPVSAQNQEVWKVTQDDGGGWGGHAVPVLGYGREGLTCVTWGGLKQMSWDFFLRYCDEAYGILSPDWLDQDGKSANGFGVEDLRRDLASMNHL